MTVDFNAFIEFINQYKDVNALSTNNTDDDAFTHALAPIPSFHMNKKLELNYTLLVILMTFKKMHFFLLIFGSCQCFILHACKFMITESVVIPETLRAH